MKKVIILAALLAVSCCAYCQQKKDTVRKSSVKVEKVDAKTFKATKAKGGSRGNGYQPIGYSYIDTDGNTYEIYSHVVSRGADAGKTYYYIQRVSKKSGKTYWKKVEVKL